MPDQVRHDERTLGSQGSKCGYPARLKTASCKSYAYVILTYETICY